MNRQQIDALVKTINVDTATGSVDARTQQIVVRLLGDLFQAIEDLDLSQTEVWKGLEDRKSTRLNSSHLKLSRMPSSA